MRIKNIAIAAGAAAVAVTAAAGAFVIFFIVALAQEGSSENDDFVPEQPISYQRQRVGRGHTVAGRHPRHQQRLPRSDQVKFSATWRIDPILDR